ncbi:hypothetical protein DM02DRAFT_734621 [Periconia macrospinosa]|uniref:Uncharacterized protein n=1 Tax=Periconia macrospinosa TaxID=97972 RepID=A0A2V1CYJ3_9PLEO|nr:hypothetical protein DM02DRAFT_734621 [Periconia macrospinosa]
MSFAGAPAPEFTAAADLLALDKTQIVRYLESNRRVDGGFDISNAAGVESLSKSQRDELGSKLRAAAEIATVSRSIDMDALLARLASIESGQDRSPELGCLRPPRESSESTVPPNPDEEYLYEDLSYHELIQDGGRPVCPIEVLLNILNEPAASREPILPWLSDPDSASRNGEMQTVYSRQLDRWWAFRKWQWDNRGTTDGDGGFSAFLAAKRRVYVVTAAAALGSSQPRQRRQNTGTVALTKRLAAARADRDTAMKAIDSFVRDTAHYRRAEATVYHQKTRVQWVLKEARVMETEVPQHRGTAKNNPKSDAGESKKRRRSDDDVVPAEPWSKRTRRGRGGKDAVPDTLSRQRR